MEVEHGHEFDHTTPSNLKNMTADEAGTWILEHTPDSFQVLYMFRIIVCNPDETTGF